MHDTMTPEILSHIISFVASSQKNKRSGLIAPLFGVTNLAVCEFTRKGGMIMLTLQIKPKSDAVTLCFSEFRRKFSFTERKFIGYQLCFPF